MAIAVPTLLALAALLVAVDRFRPSEALIVIAGMWLFV
jgi:hypothetical protein